MKTQTICGMILVTLFLFSSATADAAFDGDYTLNNWTFQTVGTGTVSPSSGDSSMITLSSDDSEVGGYTDFFITITTPGQISFDWFFTNDDLPSFEFGGYILNGTRTNLSGAAGASSLIAMNQLVSVLAGDTFGFYVESADGIAVPGYLDITNFSGPQAVPLPASVWFLLTAVAGLGSTMRRRSR